MKKLREQSSDWKNILMKHGVSTIQALIKLMNSCWEEKCVTDDWRKGVIIKMLKKGDMSNCDKSRGITLLSIPGSLLTNNVKSTSRCSRWDFTWRAGRLLPEVSHAQNKILHCATLLNRALNSINFIFKKAFDSMHNHCGILPDWNPWTGGSIKTITGYACCTLVSTAFM